MSVVDDPHSPGEEMGDLYQRSLLAFRHVVLEHYASHGRELPWRRTRDPYRILVSEIMLQQTQVSRVLHKYDDFLARFPSIWALADSPTAAVLSAWQGLGYNRRGLALQRTAQTVTSVYGGTLPRSPEGLRALPGVGPATAGAIAAFAFGSAVPFIETNIRAAILHHFFPGRLGVSDREVLTFVEATLDREDPRTWYYALMDYGSWLKQLGPNPSRRSKHHVSQTPFAGSRRQLRAEILRLFLAQQGRLEMHTGGEGNAGPGAAAGAAAQCALFHPSVSLIAEEVAELLPEWDAAEVGSVLEGLAREGFFKKGAGFSLR